MISIHALRGEGDINNTDINIVAKVISIHALRGEGDKNHSDTRTKTNAISIHALRGEGDGRGVGTVDRYGQFQSTPSVGRATSAEFLRRLCSAHFNPRPPWGGRLKSTLLIFTKINISIHALRGEGDAHYQAVITKAYISLHALRGEGDCCITPPCSLYSTFQSTPSVGRATQSGREEC